MARPRTPLSSYGRITVDPVAYVAGESPGRRRLVVVEVRLGRDPLDAAAADAKRVLPTLDGERAADRFDDFIFAAGVMADLGDIGAIGWWTGIGRHQCNAVVAFVERVFGLVQGGFGRRGNQLCAAGGDGIRRAARL